MKSQQGGHSQVCLCKDSLCGDEYMIVVQVLTVSSQLTRYIAGYVVTRPGCY